MNIREHLERIRDRHAEHGTVGPEGYEYELCDRCDYDWPCPDFEDAVAALAQLPEDDQHVWIPDYVNPGVTTSFTGFGIDPAPYGHRGYVRYALVPDPLVPRLDANPNTKEDT